MGIYDSDYRQQKSLLNLHSITIPRIMLCLFFNITLFFIFGMLYNWEFESSTFYLYISFIILMSPICFVKDVFHPIYILISIQILPLINFLDKDLHKASLRYVSHITSNELAFVMSYSILIIIVWFILLYVGFIIATKLPQSSFINYNFFSEKLHNPNKIAIILLLISIISFIYVSYNMGGIMSMLNSMSRRVEAYSGKTYFINFVSLGSISSVLFLYSGKRKTSILVNILTFLSLSLFGGRESAFFGVIFPYLIFYNFFYKKIPLRKLGILLVFAVVFGLTLGNFRHYGDFSFQGIKLGNILFQTAKGKATADILPSL